MISSPFSSTLIGSVSALLNGSAKPALDFDMSSPMALAKARAWADRANAGDIASCPALSTICST